MSHILSEPFFRILVVLIAILHFVLIEYNCYVRELDAADGLPWWPRGALSSGILKMRKKCPGLKVPCSAWIAILYVYIIWSSVKYDANYMNLKDLSSKSELNQKRRGDSVSDEPTKSFSKSQGHPHKEKNDCWTYHGRIIKH